jgi:hypothetical protein
VQLLEQICLRDEQYVATLAYSAMPECLRQMRFADAPVWPTIRTQTFSSM